MQPVIDNPMIQLIRKIRSSLKKTTQLGGLTVFLMRSWIKGQKRKVNVNRSDPHPKVNTATKFAPVPRAKNISLNAKF